MYVHVTDTWASVSQETVLKAGTRIKGLNDNGSGAVGVLHEFSWVFT